MLAPTLFPSEARQCFTSTSIFTCLIDRVVLTTNYRLFTRWLVRLIGSARILLPTLLPGFTRQAPKSLLLSHINPRCCDHLILTASILYNVYAACMTMALRRPHRKSRHGCLECKRRRVKVRPYNHSIMFLALANSIPVSAMRPGQPAQIARNAMQSVNMAPPPRSSGQMKSPLPAACRVLLAQTRANRATRCWVVQGLSTRSDYWVGSATVRPLALQRQRSTSTIWSS